MKRNNTLDSQSLTNKKRHPNKEDINILNQLLLQPKTSRRRLFMIKTDQIQNTIGSTTTTATMPAAAVQSIPLNNNQNNSSNSSRSSRSSTATSSASITSSIVLYKINSQANANANRTVTLLVLLLSFYVFCWAPYNVYTWYHAYQVTHSTKLNIPINNLTSFTDSNQTTTSLITSATNNLNADLRRIIYINYALYLLSMISMCFSFIFYFSLNKHARHEFSRFTGCICPWINHMQNGHRRKKSPKQEQERSRHLQYDTRYHHRHYNRNERMKLSSPPPLHNNRHNYMTRMSYPQYATSKRTVLDYGCRIQCCP